MDQQCLPRPPVPSADLHAADFDVPPFQELLGSVGGLFPASEKRLDGLENLLSELRGGVDAFEILEDGEPIRRRFGVHLLDHTGLANPPFSRNDNTLTIQDFPDVPDECVPSDHFLRCDVATRVYTHVLYSYALRAYFM